MRSPLWICKKNEIACHIRKLFAHYGEPMDYFDEYLAGVLEHDIDEALACFRDLVRHMEWQKPANKDVKNEQRLHGMQYQPPFVKG